MGTGPTNPHMQQLIADLKKAGAHGSVPLWDRIAEDLSKPTRQRRVVNIYKLDNFTKEGETVIVPGKVLGSGEIRRKLKVAAFTFSQQAVEKITKAGGQTLAIHDVIKQNPKGKNVRILG